MLKHEILLVDDEQNILNSLHRLLRNEGYTIKMATSAEDGMELLEKDSVDLVVSDYKMLGMNGLEFLKQVKDKFPHIIRIILTGQTETSLAISAINEGEVFRFLTKPWDEKELKITLKQALEFYDILKGTKGLLQASNLLKNLEIKYPEIADELELTCGEHFVSEDEVSSLEELMKKYTL